MDEGQHVDHRQLPQRVPADEHHGEDQVAAAQPVQEVGVLGELVLQEQDDRQQTQGGDDHADLEALLVPDVDPHRPVGLFDRGQLLGRRLRPLDVGFGHLVRQLEAGEHPGHRAGLAAYQQLQRPGRARVEGDVLADDEDRHLAELGHAFGIDVRQADVVQIAEADDVAELAQLHPIEDAAAHIARALERVVAAAEHGDRVFARLERAHQVGVLRLTKQVAADGRRVEFGGVQVDEGLALLVRLGLVDAFGFGALEGLVDLAVGQQQAADRAVAGQLGPAGRLVHVGANGRRFAAAAGGGLDQLERGGHLVGGAHDDLVDHHDGHGGAGHGIDGHCVAVAGMPDHHALVGLHALVLGSEVVQLLLGNADQQDRLVVLEHVGILDRALRIEQHLEVDRLAGVGRDVDDVDRLEGVAEDFVTLAQGSHLVFALGFGDLGLRKDLLDALALDFVLARLEAEAAHHQREEDHQAVPPRSQGAAGGKTMGFHAVTYCTTGCAPHGR